MPKSVKLILDDDTYARLTSLAAAQRRSIAGQVLFVLEQALVPPAPVTDVTAKPVGRPRNMRLDDYGLTREEMATLIYFNRKDPANADLLTQIRAMTREARKELFSRGWYTICNPNSNNWTLEVSIPVDGQKSIHAWDTTDPNRYHGRRMVDATGLIAPCEMSPTRTIDDDFGIYAPDPAGQCYLGVGR